MMFPLVLDLAADSIPAAVTCRVLGFSKRIDGAGRDLRRQRRQDALGRLTPTEFDILHQAAHAA